MNTKIGIIVAMDEEAQAVKHLMQKERAKTIYDLNFIIGTIHGKECILVKSGVGKVNAARTTQILITYFSPTFVMNVGVAGSVNFMLDIGDVVIGEKVVQHDFDITAFGHSKGYISGIGNNIPCQRDLSSRIYNSITNPEEKNFRIVLGTIATGDTFCTKVAMKDEIRATFDADVVDMECGAIAQTCLLDNIPFVAIRSVSDKPNGKNANTFEENLNLACKRFSFVLDDFLLAYQ